MKLLLPAKYQFSALGSVDSHAYEIIGMEFQTRTKLLDLLTIPTKCCLFSCFYRIHL